MSETEPSLSVLDACVLIPASLRDVLLRAAAARLYQPYWSEEILEEVRRNLVRREMTSPARADPLDATATVVDLAVRGYLRIIEIQSNGVVGRMLGGQDWQIEKTKVVRCLNSILFGRAGRWQPAARPTTSAGQIREVTGALGTAWLILPDQSDALDGVLDLPVASKANSSPAKAQLYRLTAATSEIVSLGERITAAGGPWLLVAENAAKSELS